MTAEITFRPTPEDAPGLAAALSPRLWGRYERLRLVIGGALIMLLVFFLIASYNWKVWGLFILRPDEMAGFAVGGAAAGWLWGRRKLPDLAPDDPRLGRRTVTVAPEGLRIVGEGFRTEIDWAAVERIERREDMILFMTAWKDVHFVPRRVFRGPEAADGFETAARAAWSAARMPDATP